MSGEDIIYRRGIGQLYDEIRQCVLQSTLLISPVKTVTKRGGKTGIPGLSDGINKGLAESLKSLGWKSFLAPGASGKTAKIDWYKAVPSGISYGPAEIGLGLEVQFGNNFQFYGDLHRMSEAVLAQNIVAGVCIVASDLLDKYTSDRAAHFRSEKIKLDRFVSVFSASGAAIIPGFVLIGIEQDGFLADSSMSATEMASALVSEDYESLDDESPDQEDEESEESEDSQGKGTAAASPQAKGIFKLTAPIFDSEKGTALKPVRFVQFGTAT